MYDSYEFYLKIKIKLFKSIIIKGGLVICVIFIFLSIYNKKMIFSPTEYNEKATIGYLKDFCMTDITKIKIMIDGNYSKFEAVCLFEIKDKKMIKEFKDIINRDTIISEKILGKYGRRIHLTLFNKDEKYSFIMDGEPYSGNRPINEMYLSFFLNPKFDVTDSFNNDPGNAMWDNIYKYEAVSTNLQNYKMYFFLKKYIIDFIEEHRPNSDKISGKCYKTYVY